MAVKDMRCVSAVMLLLLGVVTKVCVRLSLYDCLHTSHILMQAARTSSTLHEHVPCISRELLTAPCPRREVALYTVPSFVLRGELKWS